MGRKKSQPQPPETSLPSDNGEELLSTRDLMRFLNLSRTKIWELVNHEGLPAFKIGGDYRYRKNEVVAWLEKYRVKKDEG
jgi:excisionase family DNA binding protein